MPHDVFISYSSKDRTVADALCATLESQGIACWIAPRNITYGSDYGEAIVDGINESRVMVLVFSSHANTSPHIKREVDRAVSKGLTIIPIRIEDVAPTRALEYYISPVHWLDALSGPMDGHLRALGEKIRVLLDRLAAERAPAPVIAAPVAAPLPAPAAAPAATISPPAPAPVRLDGGARVEPRVDPKPPAPRRRLGVGAGLAGAGAVAVIAAVLWLQPWDDGEKVRKAAALQAQADEDRRKEAARQAQVEEDRRREAARQAQLDADRRRDEARQTEERTRAAEAAAKRAEDAVRRLDEAGKADAARRAKMLEDQQRSAIAPPARTSPPGPVARLDPTAAKGQVEQRLRSRGLLKQASGDRWGVTVDMSPDGVVTLTGVLQNNDQRAETVRLAGEVPGVAEVKQRINVQQSWTR